MFHLLFYLLFEKDKTFAQVETGLFIIIKQ